MCGIAGFLSGTPSPDAEHLVRSIVEDQLHRGPDYQTVEPLPFGSGTLVFGHDRLSILDLSAAAHQPLFDPQRRACIILNGEIYNFIELRRELEAEGVTFQTNGDSEVALQAYLTWGLDFVERLNGMFAFAIADLEHQRVVLVRDRFGVKPLYLYRADGIVAFASTGRVLAREFSLEPDLGYLHQGIATLNFDDSSGRTQYQGLESLRPGTMLVAETDNGRLTLREHRWYDIESRVERQIGERAGWSDKEWSEQFLAAFESAVDIRLRADVPVAVSLSGGLDSASVAALAARHDRSVKAFTLGDASDASSEGPLAKEAADKAGIDITFVRPDLDALTSSFLSTLDAQDAPFAGGSQVAQYLVAQQVRAEGYTVLLGGQGGDEGYMGYRKYFIFALKSLLASKRYGDAASLGMQIARMMIAEGSNLRAYWRHRGRFAEARESTSTVLAKPPGFVAPSLGLKPGQPVWKRQLLDITDWSLPTLLRYEDRNGMAHSIESRLPFMDYRVLELGLSAPTRLKVNKAYGKWLVRQAMAGQVPDSIRLARYKRGYPVDTAAWLESGLGDTLRGWITQSTTCLEPFLDRPLDVSEHFSNERLLNDVQALPELLSMAWIARSKGCL